MREWRKDKLVNFLICFIISTVMVLPLWYLTGIAHELGHGLVCWATGGVFLWDLIFTKLALLCDPFPEHVKEISWAMGGSFGVIASIVPIFVFRFLRKWNFILNAFLGCAFMQLGYAIFESTQNALYRVNDLSAILPIALMGIIPIIVFTLYIEKITQMVDRFRLKRK
jgi:hypothetical protein